MTEPAVKPSSPVINALKVFLTQAGAMEGDWPSTSNKNRPAKTEIPMKMTDNPEPVQKATHASV